MATGVMSLLSDNLVYFKSFRRIIPTVKSVLLFTHMESLFVKKPKGFSKFIGPCDHKDYVPGQSWCEELGLSRKEFRNAFKELGVFYPSKEEFNNAPLKFQGKWFCAYYDRQKGKVYYHRNHVIVDAVLAQLFISLIHSHEPYVPEDIPRSPGESGHIPKGNVVDNHEDKAMGHKVLENKGLEDFEQKKGLLSETSNSQEPSVRIVDIVDNTYTNTNQSSESNYSSVILGLEERGLEREEKPFNQVFPEKRIQPTVAEINTSSSPEELYSKIRGRRISANWVVNSKLRADLLTKHRGLSDSIIDEQAEVFLEHWLQSALPSALKVNWDLAFRTWIRNYFKFGFAEQDAKKGSVVNGSYRPKVEVCKYCEVSAKNPGQGLECHIHVKK